MAEPHLQKCFRMWQFLGHACTITNRKRESEHYVYVWEVTGCSCQKNKTLSNRKSQKVGRMCVRSGTTNFVQKATLTLHPCSTWTKCGAIFHPFLWNMTIHFFNIYKGNEFRLIVGNFMPLDPLGESVMFCWCWTIKFCLLS